MHEEQLHVLASAPRGVIKFAHSEPKHLITLFFTSYGIATKRFQVAIGA